MIDMLFALVRWFIQAGQPALVPLCFVLAWGLLLLTGFSLWGVIRASVVNARQMHQIPCARCRFFTGDYHLKCPVRPVIALSELAVNCPDYESLRTY